MQIDAATFFTLVGALAAGGVGGYVASEHGMLKAPRPPQGEAAAPAAAASATLNAAPPQVVPACDDMIGSPASCPAPGYPAEEGGCGALPTKRCEDFKQTMKPRVAERAVACLNALRPAERCDPNRLSLCGHLALMGACPTEPIAASSDAGTAADDVAVQCSAIEAECTGVAMGPSALDCRATLSGMNIFGRARMVQCMRTHCADKGLLGCEAASDVR